MTAGAGLTKTGDELSIDEEGVVTGMLADGAVTPGKTQRLQQRTETANQTLVIGDIDARVEINSSSARTVTVPTNAAVAYPVGTCIEIVRWGTGAVTITPAGGVTILSPDNEAGPRDIAARYGVAHLYKRGADEWHLTGDLE